MVPGVPAEAPQAATPRNASTTVLLRDAPGGLEAYLLVRSSRLAAFAGMTVFPGGSVDPGDSHPDEPLWQGPDPASWPLSADPDLSRALAVAAVRETFEEIGVLLAQPAEFGGAFPTVAELAADRELLETGQVTLPGLLRSRGLVISTELLRPWAHWITPVVEKRRFDTRFFVAELPFEQEVREPSGEAVRGLWARPTDALETVRRGELGMLPPTASMLLDISQYATVAEVFAASVDKAIRPVQPQFVKGTGLTLPPEAADLVPPGMNNEFISELFALISRRA
jgi:8-oxo-dGTP pyrophosphatase MutT (NUDIX family)